MPAKDFAPPAFIGVRSNPQKGRNFSFASSRNPTPISPSIRASLFSRVPATPRSQHPDPRVLVFASWLLCFVTSSTANTLKITRNPAGLTGELDGVLVGSTPFAKDFPGGCFDRAHTALGARARAWTILSSRGFLFPGVFLGSILRRFHHCRHLPPVLASPR